MKSALRLSSTFLSGALLVLHATAALGTEPKSLTLRYTVSFSATSTLHDFEGQSGQQTATVSPLEPSAGGGWKADLRLPVSSLETGDESRDEKMRAMFEVERYPEIRAEFEVIDPNSARPSANGTSRLPFRMTIHNVTQPVSGLVSHWNESSKSVEFDVQFDVYLHEFGLEAPSTLGILRVGDRVQVTVHAVVTPS